MSSNRLCGLQKMGTLVQLTGAVGLPGLAAGLACVCRLHAVAGRPVACDSGQWRKRIRGMYTRRWAIQIDHLFYFLNIFSFWVSVYCNMDIRHLSLIWKINMPYMYIADHKKLGTLLLSISSPIIDWFSKFFHWHTLQTICNNVIIINMYSATQ